MLLPAKRTKKPFANEEEIRAEWDEHPEWHDLTREQLSKKKEARSFYARAAAYARRAGDSENERMAIRDRIFPGSSKENLRREYHIDGRTVCFDSNSERIIGIILHDLELSGLVEGEELHIPTSSNEKSRASIDFRIGDCLLEYHPRVTVWDSDPKDRQAWRKRLSITREDFRGLHFAYITTIEQLYDVLTDPEIQRTFPAEAQGISRKQFNRMYRAARMKAAEADAQAQRFAA